MQKMFEYGSMWNHFRKNVGVQTDDVVVFVYDADFKSMKAIKYDRDGKLKPFISRGMIVKQVAKEDRLVSENIELCRHGLFIVFEDSSISKKKALYLVMPAKRLDFFTGDHLSFLVNNGVPVPKRLQLHDTQYIPNAHGDGTTGKAVHYPSHLPLEFDLPGSSDDMKKILSKDLSIFAPFLLNAFSCSSHHHVGGGNNDYRRMKKKLRKNSVSDFDDIWHVLPLKRLFVIAIRRIDDHEKFDVTVIVIDRLHHPKSHPWTSFVLPGKDASNLEGDIRVSIVDMFKTMKWDDFATNGPD